MKTRSKYYKCIISKTGQKTILNNKTKQTNKTKKQEETKFNTNPDFLQSRQRLYEAVRYPPTIKQTSGKIISGKDQNSSMVLGNQRLGNQQQREQRIRIEKNKEKRAHKNYKQGRATKRNMALAASSQVGQGFL